MSGLKKGKRSVSFFLCLSPAPIVSKFLVWNFSMTQGCLETFKSDCCATSKVSDLEGTKWTHSHWTWIDSSWQRCHTLRAKLICSIHLFLLTGFLCLFPWLLFPSSVYQTLTWRSAVLTWFTISSTGLKWQHYLLGVSFSIIKGILTYIFKNVFGVREMDWRIKSDNPSLISRIYLVEEGTESCPLASLRKGTATHSFPTQIQTRAHKTVKDVVKIQSVLLKRVWCIFNPKCNFTKFSNVEWQGKEMPGEEVRWEWIARKEVMRWSLSSAVE